MRRHLKVKSASSHVSLRKTATSGSAASRRNFPAWIDAGEAAVVFTAARRATPRVRDGLVLRSVSKKMPVERSVPHGSRSR